MGIFVNHLPTANTDIALQITDKDLATYGLLENYDNEKIAHTSDFPSDKTFSELKRNLNKLTKMNHWRYCYCSG